MRTKAYRGYLFAVAWRRGLAGGWWRYRRAVYALHIEDLMRIAQSRLTRSWRLEECQRFLHQEQCP